MFRKLETKLHAKISRDITVGQTVCQDACFDESKVLISAIIQLLPLVGKKITAQLPARSAPGRRVDQDAPRSRQPEPRLCRLVRVAGAAGPRGRRATNRP